MTTDNLTRAEAAERAALISNLTYDIALTLHDTPGRDTFESIATVEFDCSRSGASFMDLDAPSVSRIEINGEAISTTAFEDHRIVLNGLVEGRNTVRIVAACAYQHTGVGLHRVVDPVDERIYLFTHFEPFDAHKVFACFDQPDLKGPFSLHVTAPQAWRVISNGAIESEEAQPGSQRLTHFVTTPPISTYLAAVVAGPFHAVFAEHGNIPLGIFCRESLAQHLDPEEIFEITRQGLDFFEDYFEYPYPFGKYDQLMVPEFNMGAMENPGCVTFNEAYVFRSKVTDASRSRRANTILHEMAHMWFGDLVTMRWWDDLWLNESFATYMATLAVYECTRFKDSYVDFANATKSWAARQDQLPSTHPIAADMVDTESVRLNFDGITYAKGASVLRQLVAWVGDEAFREALRGYFQDFQWSNATLAEFLAALEKSSGRELGSWSKEWLETAGIATLRPESTSQDGSYTDLAVLQAAPPDHPTLRSHRLGLGFYSFAGEDLRRTRRIEIDVRGARTEVPEATGERVPDLLLINDGDLAFAKVRLDRHSAQTLVASMSRIDDPLTRALCWASAWDMTRDAELPTRRYVSLFAGHARAETEVGSLERLIGQVLAAIDMYGAPDNRLAARAQVHAGATAALAAAEPEGDLQLAWARCLISTSDTDRELAFIEGLLEDTQAIEGLTVDTDLRWLIVGRLAAAGRAGEELITAELNRDPTDIGRRRAAGALAARPEMAAKEDAWGHLLNERNVPLATMNAIMGGFSQPGRDDLLRPFVDRYAEALPQIWSERSVDEAMDLTGGLYPTYIVDDGVIAAVDRALAGALPPPAQRILVENRDGTLRAQRARAADAPT